MTLGHLDHQLTCPECQDALRQDPPEPPHDGQCSLALNDEDPPAMCPHPRSAGWQWCDAHASEKLTEIVATITGQVAQLDRALAGCREQLRELDEGVQLARRVGASDTDMLPILLTRGQIAHQIDSLASKKRAAEEWLATVTGRH
jgi:hypothetical protein